MKELKLKQTKPASTQATHVPKNVFKRLGVHNPKRTVINVVILLVVFWLGVGLGNGTIGVSRGVDANKALPSRLDYADVNRLYDLLKDKYDGKLNESQLENGLKTGLINAAGDPYTEYFSPEDAQKFNDQLSGSFTGIGAELGKDKNGNLIVISPIAGFPADKAGLKAKDIIVTINGASTQNMSIDDAVSKIRGPKDTAVKLGVIRGSEHKDYTITRDSIKIPSVKSEILPQNIGYLQIFQFSDDTATLTHQAVQKFKDAHVKSVILDLRGNPGGEVDAAVSVASEWLPEGRTILQEKRDGRVEQTYKATGSHTIQGMPTVVMIDGGSASASEIVSGALKDNKAATLLGEKSYGKGSVQQILGLNDGSEVKITVARWYRPNGQNIDKKGIEPDIKVSMTEDDFNAGHDPQKDKAIEQLLNK